jgi:hypothetical protein
MAILDNYNLRYNTGVKGLEVNTGGETWIPQSVTKSFTNVSADIGTVGAATTESTIFTPVVSGMYLYSFYGITTVNGSEAAPNLYLAWTDEVGAEKNYTFAGNLDPVHSDGANQLSIPIYAMAGTPIWMATAQGAYLTTRWSFYFNVTTL